MMPPGDSTFLDCTFRILNDDILQAFYNDGGVSIFVQPATPIKFIKKLGACSLPLAKNEDITSLKNPNICSGQIRIFGLFA